MRCVVPFLLLPFAAFSSTVILEAEKAVEVEAPMVLETPASSTSADVLHTPSCGAYLHIPEKAGNPPALEKGFARYEVEIPDAGGYYVWARVLWEGECSNSFTVQIDSNPPFIFGEDMTFNAWHWVKYPVSRVAKPIQLSAGKHTVIFRNREDGVSIDQILLTTEKRKVPVGIEANK